MRQIEFRAIDLETKKWVHGHYWTKRHGKTTLHFIKNTKLDFDTLINEHTLGQYTGLKDKSKIRIEAVEGDIVTTKHEESSVFNDVVGKIVFNDMGCFVINYIFKGEKFEHYLDADFTIIGNIHNDKELL